MRKVFLVFLVLGGLIFAAGCNSPVSLDKDGGIVIKGEDGEKVKIGEDGLEFTGGKTVLKVLSPRAMTLNCRMGTPQILFH